MQNVSQVHEWMDTFSGQAGFSCRHWKDPLSRIIKTATPHLPPINSMQLRTIQSGFHKTEVQQANNS